MKDEVPRENFVQIDGSKTMQQFTNYIQSQQSLTLVKLKTIFSPDVDNIKIGRLTFDSEEVKELFMNSMLNSNTITRVSFLFMNLDQFEHKLKLFFHRSNLSKNLVELDLMTVLTDSQVRTMKKGFQIVPRLRKLRTWSVRTNSTLVQKLVLNLELFEMDLSVNPVRDFYMLSRSVQEGMVVADEVSIALSDNVSSKSIVYLTGAMEKSDSIKAMSFSNQDNCSTLGNGLFKKLMERLKTK